MAKNAFVTSCNTRQRLRAALHLVALLGLLLPPFFPAAALAGAQPAAEPVMSTRLLPEIESPARPPYLPGKAPLPSAGGPAAGAVPLSTALLPSWLPLAENESAAEPLDAPALAGRSDGTADASLGISLLPSWFESGMANVAIQTAVGAQGLLSPAAAGQCVAPADLDITLALPPDSVCRGNTNGEVFSATLTNNGTISITELSLLVNPNVGFFYVGGSASVSAPDSPSISGPGTTAPDTSFVLNLTGATPGQQALEPGETIVISFRLATTADAASGQRLDVTVQSGDSPTVQCETRGENVETARGNLVLTKSPASQVATFGDIVTWTATLLNNGLCTVYDAQWTDTPGAGLANVSIEPTPSPITLTVSASIDYTVTAQVASCSDLTNQAEGTWSIGNEDAIVQIRFCKSACTLV